jgi:hypothetical protein
VNANDFVLVQGISHTRETLADWNGRPWQVIRAWVAWSLVVAIGLLTATYVIAKVSTPDPTPLYLPGVNYKATSADVGHVLYRNSLVLALHAMACVAGFIAGSSLPLEASRRSGVWRWVHDKAGPLAIGFVVCATTFSLVTQAYVLGHGASTLSYHLGTSPGLLLLGIAIHALPELVALFLPLAAWVIASRRGDWHQLLAATFVTVAIAVPVLVVAAFVEVYLSPHVLVALAS